MSAGAPVVVDDHGPVRRLVLDRPQKRNALDGGLVDALAGALEDAKGSSARCIAITGAGKVFSAGADLGALRAMRDSGYDENLADSRRLASLLESIHTHPLPIIAAVNGHAIAGGCGLAVACDLTLVVEGARLGFTEVRIGFVPAIVLNFLLRAVGEKRARELCLTGRLVDAGEALRMGLVNEVLEPRALWDRVSEIGEELARGAPGALALTKALFPRIAPLPLADGLRAAAEENARARGTDECREGIDAFLEKREPRWRTE